MLGISDQTIYNWRRQHLIDTGQAPGIPSSENAELIAARRRIAELEQELPSTGAPRSCSTRWCPHEAVRGHHGDGRRGTAGAARSPGAAHLGIRVTPVEEAHYLGAIAAPCVPHRGHRRGAHRLPRRLRGPAGARRAHARARHRGLARHRRAVDEPGRAQRPTGQSRAAGRGQKCRRPPTWSSARSPVRHATICGSPTSPSSRTREGKVYCAVVLDAYSRRVVGWSIDASQTSALVTNALSMAIGNRAPDPKQGTIIHSDQAIHFLGLHQACPGLRAGAVDGLDRRLL